MRTLGRAAWPMLTHIRALQLKSLLRCSRKAASFFCDRYIPVRGVDRITTNFVESRK